MSDQHPRARRRAILMFALSLYAGAALCAEPRVSDPTRPPYRGFAAESLPKDGMLMLRSTHVSGASRSAVINDLIVSVGSRVGGAEVVAIEPGRVTLVKGAERITLTLLLPAVKNPATINEPAGDSA